MFLKHRASVLVRTAKAQRLVKEDASIWSVETKSKECSTTSILIEMAKKGVQIKELPKSHPARSLADIWSMAVVEETEKGDILTFNDRIYIPRGMRKDLLSALHSTHMGKERMYKMIKGLWIWENMRHNIDQFCERCIECQEWAASKNRQPTQEVPEELLQTGPMARLGVDLFHWAGKTYVAMVDYFSGFKWMDVVIGWTRRRSSKP